MKKINIILAFIAITCAIQTGYSQCQAFGIQIITDPLVSIQAPTPTDDYLYLNVCQGSTVNFKAIISNRQ